MLIFILMIVLTAITLTLGIIYCSIEVKCEKNHDYGDKYLKASEISQGCAFIFVILLVILLGMSFGVLFIHCTETPIRLEMENEYTIITSQLKEGKDNQYLSEQITRYNKKIIRERWEVNNLWINWFGLKCIAELPLIELGE